MPAAGAPLSAAHVIAVQRLAGNQAAARLVAGAARARRPLLQRTLQDASRAANVRFFSVDDCLRHLMTLDPAGPEFAKIKAELLNGEDPRFQAAVQQWLAGQLSPATVPAWSDDDVSDEEPDSYSDEESSDDETGMDEEPSAGTTVGSALQYADDEDVEEDVDIDPDYDSKYAVPKGKARRTRAKKAYPAINTTSQTFRGNKQQRATPVTGKMQTIQHVTGQVIQRPTQMSGRVEPMTTSGRPSAPEPASIKVGIAWKEVGSTETRNTGIVDAQKGHLMALELGGPDMPWNIVPQWGNWQANGEWRTAERKVLELAQEAAKKGKHIGFQVDIQYKAYEVPEQGSLKGLVVPTGFRMTIFYEDAKGNAILPGTVVFEGEQHQDVTDFKISARVLDKLDPP
jgi:hypothetical protein